AFIIQGNLCHMAKDYKNANECYEKALHLAMATTPVERSAILRKIGDVYRDQGNYAEAEKYYLQDLAISTDELDRASTFRKLGFICQETRSYPQAEFYYTQSLYIKEKYALEYPMILVNTLNCLGNLYCYWNKPEKAIM